MPNKQDILCGFVQMHIQLYGWPPKSVKPITNDLYALIPSLSNNAKSVKAALDGLLVVDSRLVGGSEDEFVYAHRLNDILAIRYVHNEPVRSIGWSKWRNPCSKETRKRRHVYFGHATLLQCESSPDGISEGVLRSLLCEALKNSTDYASPSLNYCALLPFGHLFELDPAQMVWLLVNKSDEERAAEWMTVDWLRLVVFLKKHAYYTKLLSQETGKLGKEITRMATVKPNYLYRTSVLFDQCLRECEVILKNLSTAEIGYYNSLEDTLGVGSISDLSNSQDFLFRMHKQLRLSNTVSQKQLENVQRQWLDIKSAVDEIADEREESAKIRIVISTLFLAADPTDATKLRLGEELREIQEKLQLAKLRDRFVIHQRMSVRAEDFSQALLDTLPHIVHFSGHGTPTGKLYFEDKAGKSHAISTDALAVLFEQFADQVNCVVLNACYSERQAKAIAEQINYVIGMSRAIGDKASIAFSVGFYQAIGAGRTIEDAYKLGCVQIILQGIPEHQTPVLFKKRQA